MDEYYEVWTDFGIDEDLTLFRTHSKLTGALYDVNPDNGVIPESPLTEIRHITWSNGIRSIATVAA
jgi:hypothetical protein